MIELPSNWQKCEDEHFKHHDPYAEEGELETCPNCGDDTEEPLFICEDGCTIDFCASCSTTLFECPNCEEVE